MQVLPRTLFAAMALTLAAPLSAQVSTQVPDASTLSRLEEGVRIRTTGPAVRDQVGLSVQDVLRGGLLTLLVRPPSVGIVVEATPGSLRYAESRRDRLIDASWDGIDHVDVYAGRSIGKGMLQGAGMGALTGLAAWGLVELIFLAADNPVVERPEAFVGIMAGAGGLVGAATMGDRWDRVHPRARN
jgi:hypothetical protein